MAKDVSEIFKDYLPDYPEKTYSNILEQIQNKQSRIDKGKERVSYTTKQPAKYRSYLMKSNRRGYKNFITLEEFFYVIGSDCVYCGSSALEIARKDNDIGYEIENVLPCCSNCYTMKGKMSNDKFLSRLKKMAAHLNY